MILGRILWLYHFEWNESPQMQQHGWANIELEAVHLVEELSYQIDTASNYITLLEKPWITNE